MTQGQQRTEQNKQGLQRWKETIPTPPSGVGTSPGVQSTTAPHVSPSGQVVYKASSCREQYKTGCFWFGFSCILSMMCCRMSRKKEKVIVDKYSMSCFQLFCDKHHSCIEEKLFIRHLNPLSPKITSCQPLSSVSQVTVSSGQSRVSASPGVGASMPTIATSVPSPTVPTTSTTISSCTTNNSLSYSVKTTPPQCSPVSSATPPASHPTTSGPSPKALVTTSVVVQTPATAATSCVTVTMGTQDQHCQSHSKAPTPSPAFSITKDQL